MTSVFSRRPWRSCFLLQRLRLLSTSSSSSQISAKGNNSLLINHGNPYLEMYSTNGNCNGDGEDLFKHRKNFCFHTESSSFQLYVSGPSHGLVCVYSDWQYASLLNPATRDVKHFSLDPYLENFYSAHVHLLGFGFDSKTNAFKIVRCITYKPGFQIHNTEIFSLNSGQAKRREIPVLGEIRSVIPSRGFGVSSVDGLCYWSTKDLYHLKMRVVSFDFAHEVFDLFTLPPCDYMNYNLHTEDCLMATFNGLPAAIRYDANYQDKFFEVWLKKKETWVKHMSIGPISDVNEPLCFLNSHGLILLDLEYQLVVYDFITKLLKKLDIKLPKPIDGKEPVVQVLNLTE